MRRPRQLDLFDAGAPSLAERPAASTRPDGRTCDALRARLAELSSRPIVLLTPTDNRVRFLSARAIEGGLSVRLHRVFLEAPERVLEALARLCDPGLRGTIRNEALAIARGYFAEHARPSRRGVAPSRSRGAVHDLESLRDRVEREYFGGDLKVTIAWGRGGRGNADLGRGGIHLRLGSYEAPQRLVRIHPVLDRKEVPEYVVEAVVYHEMLHAAEPPQKRGGRRRVHTEAFHRRERLFRHHEEAERWIAKNLRRLARWRNDRV